MATAAEPSSDQRLSWFRQRPWLIGPRDRGDNVYGLVRSYADGLYVTAQGLSKTEGDAFDILARQALAESKRAHPELRDVLSIEIKLVRLIPEAERARRYWDYRERFQRVASATEIAAYLASKPPAASGEGGNADKVEDFDTHILLDHIHRHYMLTLAREGAVRDLKHWVQRGLVRSLVWFLGIIVLAIITHNAWGVPPEPFLFFSIGVVTLFYLGRLGAAMSVIQRLQRAVTQADKDPFFEITALCTGRRGISIAMLSGGVFAILLYVVFAAGLGQTLGMSHGIFPQVGAGSEADRAAPAPETARGDDLDGERGGDTSPALRGADPNKPATGGAGSEGAREAATAPSPQPAQGKAAQTATPDPAANSAGPGDRGEQAAVAERVGVFITSFFSKLAGEAGSGETCHAGKRVCIPNWVDQIGKHLGFQSYPDFFKMLLLAFLAGFAERLVPDAIDRLTRRQGSGEPEASTATAQPVQRA